MSVEIAEATSGTLTFKLTGLVKWAEVAEAQKQAGEIIRQHGGKVRLLVIMKNVLGMEKGANWGDISFPATYDPFIEKIAIVGEKHLEPAALLFTGKGVRKVAIEFFQPAELEQAQAWLAGSAAKP